MIRLTVNPDKQPYTHIFDKTFVIIGLGGDLNLPHETLQPIHVKIVEQEGRFVAINYANDPFVTLNDLPFGKKTLNNCDLIQIGQTSLLFEGTISPKPKEVHPPFEATLVDTEEKLTEILEHVLTAKFAKNSSSQPHNNNPEGNHEILPIHDSSDKNFENDLAELAQNLEEEDLWDRDKMEDIDIDTLIRQVEELDREPTKLKEPPPSTPASPPPSPPEPPEQNDPIASFQPTDTFVDRSVPPVINVEENNSNTLAPQQSKRSLKDYYLSEFDDETEQMDQSPKTQNRSYEPASRWNWKFIGMVMGTFLVAMLFIMTVIYFTMSGRNNEDELKAAAGVTDVAMALTYAQMHHIKPQNQNWSDPEFIKNILHSILSAEYQPAINLDPHGQFSNESYLIRIYTSGDLSQFLVIAQPAPSLMQWVIPRASIVVDSTHMELRKMSDLKMLNRLLLNPSMLDRTNTNEVSQLIKQGELIPLSTLEKHAEQQGYSPPKALGLIRPGAENFVYNAPRYYHFGETFLKKALTLAENQGSGHEVEILQEEIKALSKYSNIVLYSSHGLQWATQAQKALNVFVPQNKLLVAYLKFNSKGLISGSHLLIDAKPNDVAIALLHDHTVNSNRSEDLSPTRAESPINTHSLVEVGIDHNHPLFLQLSALQASHQKSLRAFEDELESLLETMNYEDIFNFLERMKQLLNKSLKTYQDNPEKKAKTVATIQFLNQLQQLLKKHGEESYQQEREMTTQLSKLHDEYSDMPLTEFMEYVKAAKLDSFVQKHVKLKQEKNPEDEQSKNEINKQMQKIKSSKNLEELSQHVNGMAQILNLRKFPDPKILISYQSEARLQVLDKLNDFLLSNDKGLPSEDFKDDNRPLLAHIIKTAWVTDPDEFDFYISEFEVRAHPL